MATFFLENGFNNRPSFDGVVLSGYLIPTTAEVKPGDILDFENARLLVVEVEKGLFERVRLTIGQASLNALKINGIALYSLYNKEALITNPVL